MMFAAAAIAMLATMALAMVRALAGPTVFDRIAALNMVGTKVTLLIVAAGFLIDRTDYLDIALTYALINFIGTIAVLKFYRVETRSPHGGEG